MLYNREESFFGHVHRHPARLQYRHHATADGRLVKVEATVTLDGGAYASTTAAVLANACFFAAGPYDVPNAVVDGWGMRTNNPPCGAMRGFGVVQVCFAHEAQMDRLAAALGIDPLELRLRNALGPGDTLITGQKITGTAPMTELLEALAEYPLPPGTDGPRTGGPRTDGPRTGGSGDGVSGNGAAGAAAAMSRPGGAGRTADDSHVRRGVGYAASIKNLMFSEGFDDYSTAACRLSEGVSHHHLRLRGGGAGLRDPRPADRPRGARRAAGAAGPRRHRHWFGRVVVGQPPDLDVGRSGAGGLRRGARQGAEVRRRRDRHPALRAVAA